MPTRVSVSTQVWLNHLNLTLCQLAAAIVWLCHPSQRLGIRKLCLADNGLDDVAFSLLLDGMEGTMSIEHLDVSRNRLKVRGDACPVYEANLLPASFIPCAS